MIKCVNPVGFGQCCCDMCRILSGWHRHWSSDCYYVINSKGIILRYDNHTHDFTFSDSDSISARNAVFCKPHAELVDSERSKFTDY